MKPKGIKKAFVTFRSWETDKESSALTGKIFANLVEKELVTAPPANLFMASDKEKQAHMIAEINQLAENDRDALIAAFNEVGEEDETEAAASETTEENVEAPSPEPAPA